MQSKTSWFNGTLFKKNLTRFWPVWGMYLAAWTLAMPTYLLTKVRYYGQVSDSYSGFENALHWFADSQVLQMLNGAVISSAIFGLFAAMAVFSYLYNNRSAGMMHALPVRREGLFLTNYLSGLLFLAGPAIAVFFLTLGAEAIVGAVNAGALCMWLVVHLLLILFFYSFAVFCAMFTGNLLALPAFYGILNFLAYVLYEVLNFMLDQFLFGYSNIDWLSTAMAWLAPCMGISKAVRVGTVWDNVGHMVANVQFEGLFPVLVYGLVGVVLAVAALLLYRRRHLEAAGDVVSVSWVRPIFKYGVGVCAALAGGMLLYGWFGRGRSAENIWAVLVFLLPCGAIGYFAAEMLLKKSFRAFEHWKGCLVMLAAVALCVGIVRLDVFGYGSRVPRIQDVESVTLDCTRAAPYDSGWLGSSQNTDPEYIQAVLNLHAAIAADRARIEREFDGMESDVEAAPGDSGYSTVGTAYCGIDYYMKNGTRISRRYQLPIKTSALNDPATYDAQLQAMDRFPEVNLENYAFPETKDNIKLVAGEIRVYDTALGEFTTLEISSDGAAALLKAVKSDLTAGRLGRRFLLDDADRMNLCYYDDLGFYFLDKNADATTRQEDEKESSWRISVTLLATATDTLDELRRQGVLGDTHILLTQNEMYVREENLESGTVMAESARG
ncbi:MAG: ABC transporter permease [Clostridia bacterium]|nr:ABC transporter permease [Clostridia bacterium]